MSQNVTQMKKQAVQTMRAMASVWNKYGHAAAHYSIVPAIFAYGLYQAGELTFDPISLATKIFVP
jgi:uncharacterized membrane protein